MLDLNNPDTRQAAIAAKLNIGTPLVIADVAEEFGVSVDTIRRDFISLEQQGLLKRVKGGAVPLLPPSKPINVRIKEADQWLSSGRETIAEVTAGCHTIFFDGGTSVVEFASLLPNNFNGLAVTPSPLVAVELLKAGIETQLIGGNLKGQGGIATGAQTVQSLSDIKADLCVLGACGIDAGFGLSADDLSEADVKRQMILSSKKVLVLASVQKFNACARHKVAPVTDIDIIISNGPDETVTSIREAGVTVLKVNGEAEE
ncbi:DeoR/GlpR family DNA-binding transcription regulator [Sansalvadorimonas sp. 2012CJ34-2]|uniref:DeoR/GlpR family DNA-binding transcription regulator n=1 Tax=Parendozoicomonas callyspongiae TaxID=2942213 RepID=A0ABT0PHG5_9GAMM|nr:DeoR/GlpR family DNA-binding transcription regulator [Sansalvadorimonas sp. 2012CJ34-2]MCL6270829.1 DeoR/GlpR family DNA-binding transcription regulator [Sansalvadorimonas sp. 2012CJ34-2]